MWYYTTNDQRYGPLSDAELDKLVVDQVINSNTLVWKDGLAQWTPLGQARTGLSPPVALADDFAVCSICGKRVGADNLIELLGHRICAACKPMAVRRMQEGIAPGNQEGTAWRDGNLVVTYNENILPARCYKCNEPVARPPMKRKVYWHSPGYYWLILIGILVRAGLLIYIVVALFVRKRAIVSVHLCARHRMLYYYFRVGS
jgi:hypothetical protein